MGPKAVINFLANCKCKADILSTEVNYNYSIPTGQLTGIVRVLILILLVSITPALRSERLRLLLWWLTEKKNCPPLKIDAHRSNTGQIPQQ